MQRSPTCSKHRYQPIVPARSSPLPFPVNTLYVTTVSIVSILTCTHFLNFQSTQSAISYNRPPGVLSRSLNPSPLPLSSKHQGLTRFTPSPGNVLQDITNHAGTDSLNSHNGSPVWAVTSVERSEFSAQKRGEPAFISY